MRMDAHLKTTRRRGYGLLELAIGALLLAVALVLVAQVASVISLERRAIERRREAAREAANLMERLADRPATELTPDLGRAVAKSAASASSLPDPEFTVEIGSSASDPSAKRIAVAIRWGTPPRRESPVRLVGWVYRREGAKP